MPTQEARAAPILALWVRDAGGAAAPARGPERSPSQAIPRILAAAHERHAGCPATYRRRQNATAGVRCAQPAPAVPYIPGNLGEQPIIACEQGRRVGWATSAHHARGKQMKVETHLTRLHRCFRVWCRVYICKCGITRAHATRLCCGTDRYPQARFEQEAQFSRLPLHLAIAHQAPQSVIELLLEVDAWSRSDSHFSRHTRVILGVSRSEVFFFFFAMISDKLLEPRSRHGRAWPPPLAWTAAPARTRAVSSPCTSS